LLWAVFRGERRGGFGNWLGRRFDADAEDCFELINSGRLARLADRPLPCRS